MAFPLQLNEVVQAIRTATHADAAGKILIPTDSYDGSLLMQCPKQVVIPCIRILRLVVLNHLPQAKPQRLIVWLKLLVLA